MSQISLRHCCRTLRKTILFTMALDLEINVNRLTVQPVFIAAVFFHWRTGDKWVTDGWGHVGALWTLPTVTMCLALLAGDAEQAGLQSKRCWHGSRMIPHQYLDTRHEKKRQLLLHQILKAGSEKHLTRNYQNWELFFHFYLNFREKTDSMCTNY